MRKRVLFLFIAISISTAIAAQNLQSKADLTPTFWQRDPIANFEDEGRMHCAPTAVSDGLIYLDRAFGMTKLVPGIDHNNQIKLIKELASDFQTDPSLGGTNPDKILTGLQIYVKSKNYSLNRLELMSWRSVSNSNRKFHIGAQPDIDWMRNAVRSKDTVVIFNFGWYYKIQDGYRRHGGHWVDVVGAAANSNEFYVHNPAISAQEQSAKTTLKLTQLNKKFTVVEADVKNFETNMIGYYIGEGPGLPHSDNISAAVLDSVIVFSIKP